MPVTMVQWFVFLLIESIGVVVCLGVQWLFMKKLLNPKRLADKLFESLHYSEEQRVQWRRQHLGTALQEWIGVMEIILYSSAIVFGYPEFIAVWFATKYIATWRGWVEEQVARSFYNRSLFGSGLNVILGAATGGLARLAIKQVASCGW